MKTVNTQQWGALFRQGLALAGIVFGVLTSSVSSLHLPTSVSAIMAAGGAVILAVEHFVSDPSTGTPAPPTVKAPAPPAPPAA